MTKVQVAVPVPRRPCYPVPDLFLIGILYNHGSTQDYKNYGYNNVLCLCMHFITIFIITFVTDWDYLIKPAKKRQSSQHRTY